MRCTLSSRYLYRWIPTPNAPPYRPEFEDDDINFGVAVDPQITTNDLNLMVRIALAGGGTEIDRGSCCGVGRLASAISRVLSLLPEMQEYGA